MKSMMSGEQLGSATLCSSLLRVDLLRHPPAVSNRRHVNCKHNRVVMGICPADVFNVAVLGVSVSLLDDGKVLSNTPYSYASVVAEVGSVAAVIVTDVFC
mmetsp:Transcript_26123/g.38355  ORF Transcript_26123/g.38355 Transcript_26123/m.38355 type:complete len:100 (+) Transcript_26123:85-384(+)